MLIPGGMNPERTLFIDGFVIKHAQWFCFSLQSGPSLHGEDDVIFFYMVHIRNDITTFTQNSYLRGNWYDATEYENLCQRIEKELAAAKKSNVNADERTDGDTSTAAAKINAGQEPSTSKLKNHKSTGDDVKSLEYMLKTLHSFHSKETTVPDNLQTRQSFDETASTAIASYTYSDSIVNLHETEAMESTKTLVNYTDNNTDHNEDKDITQTSTPLWNYADFIREIAEYLGIQTNLDSDTQTLKEINENERESTYRDKQITSIGSADETIPGSSKRISTRVDHVPVSSKPSQRAICNNTNPIRIFEKIVENNKLMESLYRCPQNKNKRKESEQTQNLEKKDREMDKKLRNIFLTHVQTLIVLSTRKYRSKDSVFTVVSEQQLEEPFTYDELHELHLRPGDIFQFTLECLEHGYMVTLNEELVCVYPRLAHFAEVSHLAVAGDVALHTVEVAGGQGPARRLLMELEEDFDWTGVVPLDERNFPQVVLGSGAGAVWLVCAYVPWCPACRDFAPWLERAALELADYKIMVGAINGDRSEQLMDDLQIPYYPTILGFPKGMKSTRSILMYNGDRNNVVEWALYVLSDGIHMPVTGQVRDEPKTLRKPLSPLRRRGYCPGGGGYGAHGGLGGRRGMQRAALAALNTEHPNEEAWHPAPCEEPGPRLVSASLVHTASTVVRASRSGGAGVRHRRRQFCSTM